MKDIMLDIETLGTDSNAVIVSISAVAFDMVTGEIGEEFEVGINILEQIIEGGKIDSETTQWWSEQSKDAKRTLTDLQALPTEQALNAFNHWLNNTSTAYLKDTKLWGNGSNFDNVLVRNLYRRHGIDFVLP